MKIITKSFTMLSIFGLIACGKGGDSSNANQELKNGVPGQAAHKVSSNYQSILQSGGSTSPASGVHTVEYDISGNSIDGHQNFTGFQSGFTRLIGQRNGNVITYSSNECSGDTFQGTLNLDTQTGSFSGTICGVAHNNGSDSNVQQNY